MLRRKMGSLCAIGAFLCCVGTASAQSAFISEVLFNPPGTDGGFEAVEITGTPGATLNGWVFAVIDGDGTSSGNVIVSLTLDGFTIGTNGVLLIRDAATDLVPAPAAGTNVVVFDFNPDIQNGTQTYVLGQGAFPSMGSDLDPGNDGTIDNSPPFAASDAVSHTDGGATDSEYADDFGFPGANLGNVNPQAIYRVLTTGNAPFSWAGGGLTGANPGPYNWSTTNFGWQGVNVPDPTLRTLDLGTLNYVFESVGTGACCLASGACVTATANDCIAQSGQYQGDNSECGQVNCPQPMGACCAADGACSVTTAALCTEQLGTYQGDGTTCSPNPCPQPTGACCLGDGSCIQTTQAVCVAAGGLFSGVGFPCETIFCLPASNGPLYLSELFFNSPGADQGQETIEIVGPPNFNLDGWMFLVIEGDGNASTGAGTVDQKISLRGMTLGSNGILIIRDSSVELQPAPAAGTNVVVLDFTPDIENGANTFILGFGRFDPTIGTDLDTDNDGTFDVPLGNFTTVDAVAFSDPSNAPSFQYAAALGGENLGDVTMLPPGALYRIIDTNFEPFSWAGGFLTGANPGPYNWSATSNFGFGAVGIPDPSTETLDLGTLNFVFGEVTGGCCTPDGGCVVVSAIACTKLGGNYQGDNTNCGPPCPVACPCNFNGDPNLNSQDFFDFLACFFTPGCPEADYNGRDGVNSQDFFDFLTCFFAPPPGCP